VRLMISGASRNVNHLAQFAVAREHLGVMVTPNTGNSIDWVCSLGLPYVVDNAGFNATRFDPNRYLGLLRKVASAPSRPVFVTVPDQAPNPQDEDHSHCHRCTAYLFEEWFRVLWREKFDRLPLAFVAQNGLDDPDDVPWDRVEALFIGGDDDFKLGDFVMMDLIPEARRRGKHVHLGRVNGRRRIRLAVMADCDSVDGSSMSRFGDTLIVRFLAATAKAVREREVTDALIADLKEKAEGFAVTRRRARADVDAEYLPRLRRLLACGASRADIEALNARYQADRAAAG